MASTSTSVAPSSRIWYVDSGTSRHMTGAKDQCTHFSDRQINLEVELVMRALLEQSVLGQYLFKGSPYLP